MSQLRFAILARVSTEAQAQKGESLRSQEKHLREDVARLGGVVAREYVGQEHATEGSERRRLDQLLADSALGLFDAVIVWDNSRLSRDKRKSWDVVEVFKKNGIRYFVRTQEYDLRNPEDQLQLGFFDVINDFYAKKQAKESLLKRIDRAKGGDPTAGKLPYGRTFDKINKWGIDEGAKRKIERAAERYLQGESMSKIAKSLGMNHSFLWKTLKERCGDTWTIDFHSKWLNIKEQVIIKIPRLLSEETIRAIHEKTAANKTYTHGEIKHKYLLGRMVFCAECGYALYGQTNLHGQKTRYYRHPQKDDRMRQCSFSGRYIPAEDLESAISIEVFSMYGDVNKIEAALQQAIPNLEQMRELEQRRGECVKDLKTVSLQRDRVVDAIASGIITSEEAFAKIQTLREREDLLKKELDSINARLANIPSAKQVKDSAKALKVYTAKRISRHKVKAHAIASHAKSESHYREMDYEAKRELFQRIFAGKDAAGQRLGVYVRPTNMPQAPWQYTIRGLLGQEQFGRLPMSVDRARGLLGMEDWYDPDFNPLQSETNQPTTKSATSSPDKALHECRTRAGIAPPAA